MLARTRDRCESARRRTGHDRDRIDARYRIADDRGARKRWANLAKAATLTRLESKRTLDALREDAASSLNAVCGLTQGAIDEASRAVIAWLNALPSEPA